MTAADDRVEQAFPHADFCHVGGCPSLGFCHTVGMAKVEWMNAHPDASLDQQVIWLGAHGDCGSRECDCITSAIKVFVQAERALALDQVADAAYDAPANKPPRVVRVMRQAADLIRQGLA